MNRRAGEESTNRMQNFVEKYCAKTGLTTHPDKEVTETIVDGLAFHHETLGKPLCPCRFYPDKQAEIQQRTWICACEDMQIYKYCHCLLFVNIEGMPITEYLPDDHEGRHTYGLVNDPSPELGRPLRNKAPEREEERKRRLS